MCGPKGIRLVLKTEEEVEGEEEEEWRGKEEEQGNVMLGTWEQKFNHLITNNVNKLFLLKKGTNCS